MPDISRKIKIALVDVLIDQPDVFGTHNYYEKIIDFLNEIWPLDEMPSEDHRFSTAREDAIQHLVNNYDWEYDELLKRRFNLIDNDDEVFIKFIDTVVNPEYRQSADEIMSFVLLINPYLEKVGYNLVLQGRDESDKPIYQVVKKRDAKGTPIDVEENKIPFLVVKRPNGRHNRVNSHSPPSEYPAFVLSYNYGWNDYGYVSSFWLFYYDENEEVTDIGSLKLIIETDDGEIAKQIGDHIPRRFFVLPSNYCALGQNSAFYTSLKNIFGSNKAQSILFALRDAAIFEDIQEKFEKTEAFNDSLIRGSDAERNLREAKYKMYDYDLSNLYRFKYSFKPLYSEDGIDIDFNFDGDLDIPSRIYAIIGKNGVGKTQLLKSLPLNISREIDKLFLPRTPLFSRVIAVSYSAFDEFEMPLSKATFNYVYCGLKKVDGGLLTEKEQNARFVGSARRISNQERLNQWKVVLDSFLDSEIMEKLFAPEIYKNGDYEDIKVVVDSIINSYFKTKKMLSSGQGIMFFIITEIVAHIRFDSLLLFDEPETHLHPNAITQLMNTIYELVNQFESYCILTTHSPLIIREILSRNVYVMEKHENVPSVRRIGVESFGENLTVLTEEVFGNKDVPKQYKTIIEGLIAEGKTFEEIIELIQFGGVPVGLNTRVFIKSLIQGRND